jgi:signal transduction histidine kinase
MSKQGKQLLFLFWVVPALVAALGMHIVSVRYNPELTFIEKFGSQLLIWEAWSGWSFIILAVCDRVPFARGRAWRALAVHIPLCAIVVLGQILLIDQVSRLYGLGPEYHLESTIAIGVRTHGDILVVIYWAIVGAHAAFRWHDAWRAEALVAARLGADLAQAQLNALRAQLNPHFLFNALNSVVTLIGRDPAAAQQMIVRLSDLLRSTLALSQEQEVPLRRELDLVTSYLDIEQIRFHDRLQLKWAIDDAVRGAMVPSLVLQPLVENAIVHGVTRLSGPGRIVVSAEVRGSALVLTVSDNGPGLAVASKRRGAGIGLANLKERLLRLYGEGASLVVEPAQEGGCTATLTLPFRLAVAAA